MLIPGQISSLAQSLQPGEQKKFQPSVAVSEPGWLRTRECFSGLPIASVDSGAIPLLPKLDSSSPWIDDHTLRPEHGLGSAFRLRVRRNDQVALRDQDYRILSGDSVVVFSSPVLPLDQVCIERATSPLILEMNRPLYVRDQVPIFREQSLDSSWQAGPYQTGAANDTAISKYKLNYSGSKSMIMSLGSGGGLGLDASLFINLDGQVADDVFLEGQLSDQNVPIQPEGNTATLKEVDTKFMRVYGKHYSYVLGNYQMNYGVDGEDRFIGKVIGANGSYSRGEHGVRGSWSISEGQYQSDTLRGVDGKQRGYYLRGRDGRQFITVLAGTERIWRNGSPLKRGVDYTIDYGEGRVDFLQNLVVTGENLFSAEYQYTEQDFQRSLVSGELKDSAGAFRWSLRSISELENKDRPLTLTLDSISRPRFKAAGDSLLLDSMGRAIRMPQRHSSAAVDLSVDVSGYSGKGALLLSQLDRNLYSDLNDENNLGYSTRYQGRHTVGKPMDKGGLGRTDLLLNHEYRAHNFEAFKQLVESRGFLETWNLDSRVAQHGFLANRVTLEERPVTPLLLAGELGRANAETAGDLGSPQSSKGSVSERAGLSGRLGGEKTYIEAASEVKNARSPLRRDNYRQHGGLYVTAGGFSPSVVFTRNEWISNLENGRVTQSIKEEPEINLATPPFFGRVSLISGLTLLSERGNFGGVLKSLEDSVRDLGLTQKVEALGLGPWNSDFFYSIHNHLAWRLDGFSTYAQTPEENNFNQVEWTNTLSNRKMGYDLVSSYRISQTAEYPLVEAFDTLPGRGNYTYDKEQNLYHLSETGGDYILIGLKRDTTVGSRPYQDLSWSANLELTPAKFPFRVTGVLADIEFNLDLAMDHQDTTDGLGLLPLFLDDQIEQARSGRSRYSPAMHWKSPSALRSADIYLDRSFSLIAGMYASKELLWNQRGNYRQEVGDDWEYTLDQSYENRKRQTLASGTASITENENYAYGVRILRKLPQAFSLEGRGQYLTVNGTTQSSPIHLQGLKPALKLEKASLFNGRVFLEYGLIYFWGAGDSGYYTTADYSIGLTHRMEANANFQIGQNMYLHFDYVLRLEQQANKLTQKLTAEARAVF